MLDPATGPAMLAQASPEQLAVGMGQATYSPPRGADDPEIQALTAIFSYGGGLPVIHETIQYLVERSQDEDAWLSALAALELPTTFIWGLGDTVSPPRVVSYVWNEHMMTKPGRNSLYFVPDANHYLQNDRPEALVDAFLHALDASDDTPAGGDLGDRLGIARLSSTDHGPSSPEHLTSEESRLTHLIVVERSTTRITCLLIEVGDVAVPRTNADH